MEENRKVDKLKKHWRARRPAAPIKVGPNKRNHIYINTKTVFKAQLKRCEELLNSGIPEIYLHCVGYAITTGINLALQLVTKSSEVLGYAVNTSTIHFIDEYHPLSDADNLMIKKRNNSAVHIKIYNKNITSNTYIKTNRKCNKAATGTASS